MAFATGLSKVRYPSEHFNERTGMWYHQAPPLVRVVAHVGDARQAKPHLEHNPLSLLGTCHAMPLRKLNDPAQDGRAGWSMAARAPHLWLTARRLSPRGRGLCVAQLPAATAYARGDGLARGATPVRVAG